MVVEATSAPRRSSRTFAQIGFVRRETRASSEIFFGRLEPAFRVAVATATHRCERVVEQAVASMRFRKPLKKSGLRKSCRRCRRTAIVVVVVRRVVRTGDGRDATPTCLKKK
ncbi:hypothetical protein [Lysobacter soli]|uniref:hypothetical protein n=1 Tax=Lysobacter soli TaxID=453783 RepID=UPI0015F29F4A|nr:hypothetical protein [Lysobacter soli]